MDLKRIFRGWMLAILLVFVLLIVVLKFTGSSQYQKVATSQVVKLVETEQVKSATLTDPTQVIQVTTNKGQPASRPPGLATRSTSWPRPCRARPTARTARRLQRGEPAGQLAACACCSAGCRSS